MLALVFGLFPKMIRLPLEPFIGQTMLAFLPKGTKMTSAEARDCGRDWAGRRADPDSREAIDLYLAKSAPEIVRIELEPPGPIHEPDALDPWCWEQADESSRRLVRDAGLVLTVGSGDIPGRPLAGIASATSVVVAVAERVGGVVFDPASNLLTAPASLRRPITIVPRAESMIRLLATVDDRQRGTISTRGLMKVGLKGILWAGYPAFLERPVAVVMNAVTQRIMNLVYELGDKPPPSELAVPAELEVSLAHVEEANGNVSLTPGSPHYRGRTRIGLAREGNRGVVVPPSSYRGEREGWEQRMLAELLGLDATAWALEAGRAVIDPSQHPSSTDVEARAAVAEIGKVAIVGGRKNA